MNSCPLGMPQNFTPVGVPFLTISNVGASASACECSTDSFGEVEATSSRKLFISAACVESPPAYILKEIPVFKEANMPFSCSFMSWSSIVCCYLDGCFFEKGGVPHVFPC